MSRRYTNLDLNVSNYRPIPLLPIFYLVCEKMVLNRIFYFTFPCMSSNQHAFLPHRSSLSTLAIFRRRLFRTFDKAPLHPKHRFGVIGNFLTLLKYYLTHRTECVAVDKTKSVWSDLFGSRSRQCVESLSFYPL
ncbi:hypothetical protein J437_LFUL011597 [Ladona fulva]|uniref:Uncharacterized protein n=1 Tax=Ladona fulva TaxID=123851 RepID=A0A8K0KRA1_LADFU|nr:hypothetical protein J437_LFUL011597 [Ladona fulva]